MCVCVYVCTCEYVCMYVCMTCTHAFICMCVCVHACMHACACHGHGRGHCMFISATAWEQIPFRAQGSSCFPAPVARATENESATHRTHRTHSRSDLRSSICFNWLICSSLVTFDTVVVRYMYFSNKRNPWVCAGPGVPGTVTVTVTGYFAFY